jgi:hypothetical protein
MWKGDSNNGPNRKGETIAAASTKLQACSKDFKTFGENEWRTQCKKT